MKIHSLLPLFFLMGFSAKAQVIHPHRVCESPTVLKEFSGIALVDQNRLAALNDGGNPPTIYFLDTTGRLLEKRTFTSIPNNDWEELFFARGHLYIADVGDNNCRRKELQVYDYDLKKDTIVGTTRFNFAEKKPGSSAPGDFHYDCEAGFFMNGHFYFFSKTHATPYTGKSIQYVVNPGEKFTPYKGTDSAFFGTKGFIHNSLTGAAVSPSGEKVAFISCMHFWLRIAPKKEHYLNTGWLMDFDFEGLTQKEAVTFVSENKIVVTDERSLGIMGGRMYFFDLLPYLNGQKKYIRPQVQLALLKEREKEYDFSFESLKPLNQVTLILVNEGGEVVSQQTIELNNNKIKTVIPKDEKMKAFGFWVVADSTILYTSKISFYD